MIDTVDIFHSKKREKGLLLVKNIQFVLRYQNEKLLFLMTSSEEELNLKRVRLMIKFCLNQIDFLLIIEPSFSMMKP